MLYNEKVTSLQNLSVEEVMQHLSLKDLVTIYANLYQEKEIVSIIGYNEDGEEEVTII